MSEETKQPEPEEAEPAGLTDNRPPAPAPEPEEKPEEAPDAP